ncbi:hypothetical protein L7F22_028689 [Adiantum nelumboides]|nr:hypothetical protein [Adiantum nelumboides]
MVNGSCVCIVTATGLGTEIGKVQAQIQEAALQDEDTPLKKKLDQLESGLLLLLGFSFEKCPYYFKIAVVLAVAAILEGLSAVITTCLALRTRKMALKNAIVRKLPSVETLGCISIICSDKTGTLTTNQMSIMEMVVLEVASICNDSRIAAVSNEAGVAFSNHQFCAIGIPTEAALKVLVEKIGVLDREALERIRKQDIIDHSLDYLVVKLGYCDWYSKRVEKVALLEFDRGRKSMDVIVRTCSGDNKLLVKGAVENVLERSSYLQLANGTIVSLDNAAPERLLVQLKVMSSKALRCLAFAYKEDLGDLNLYDGERHPTHCLLLDPSNYSAIQSGLIFVGMVGLRDPPQEEVYNAVYDCKEAGFWVLVITGDNKNTAENICWEIGVFHENEDFSNKSFTRKELLALPDNDRRRILSGKGGLLFSRAEPKHKQEIVRMLKNAGELLSNCTCFVYKICVIAFL